MPKTVQVVSLGLVLMAVAFLFPTIIGGMNDGTATANVEIGNGTGDVAYAEDAMRLYKVSQSGDRITVNVTSVQTGNQAEVTLSQSETVTFQLDNETITMQAINVESGESSALLQLEYPVDMGWTPESSAISENLPVVFVSLPLVIIAGFIAAVIRS